jgi:hypothetical protein
MGAAPAVPVKSSTCVSCEPPVSVSTNEISAVRVAGIVEVGLKVTEMVQVEFAGTAVPQVLV